jgi:hypothetical protein
MDIKPDRMISLGYGKYWRSDAIVGLVPVHEERGPGRRTLVYTSTVGDPVIASRSHQAILQDMGMATDELIRLQDVRESFGELVDSLEDIPDILKRTLLHEAKFDSQVWARRLKDAISAKGVELPSDQNDLFEEDEGS